MVRSDPLPRLAIGIAALALAGAMASIGAMQRADAPAPAPIDALGLTLTRAGQRGMLVVDSLRSRGDAERAGVRVGDLIEAVNGEPAASVRQVARALPVHRPIDFRVRRGDTALHLYLNEPPGTGFGQQGAADRRRPVHG